MEITSRTEFSFSYSEKISKAVQIKKYSVTVVQNPTESLYIDSKSAIVEEQFRPES